MFGYIRPLTAELKVREYELYRAVYCGLCASLGKHVSFFAKFTLSYDFVFLALVRMAAAGEIGKIERRRCIAHPTKKRAVVTDCSQLDRCAEMSALLTLGKLRDDISDEKGMKRLSARLLLPMARHMGKRAERSAGRIPETDGIDRTASTDFAKLDKTIQSELDALALTEKENILSPDAAAEPFGRLMAAVCSYGFAENSREARLTSEIGRHIGRFIYIVDAVDDLPEDLKNRTYNPFAEGDDPLTALAGKEDELRNALTMELVGVSRAVELFNANELPDHMAIIRNIIYLGLPKVIDDLFTAKNEHGNKKSPCAGCGGDAGNV